MTVHAVVAKARAARRTAKAAAFRGPEQDAYRAALAALRAVANDPFGRPADKSLAAAEFRAHDYRAA